MKKNCKFTVPLFSLFSRSNANIVWKFWAAIKTTYALEWLRLQILRAVSVEEEEECSVKWHNHFNKLVVF